jgi:hypothetical protein
MYNASAVKCYNTTSSQVRFYQKYFVLLFKNTLAYYNASIVVANAAVVGLASGV